LERELLSWFGNLLSFVIFVYIFSKNIGSICFNVFEMGLSLFGLGASIFIQAVSLSILEGINDK
jgi:hypothetical protein